MDLLKKFLKFCFTFKGRLNRKKYILFMLGAPSILVLLLSPFLFLPEDYTPPMNFIFVAMVFFLPLAVVIGIGGWSCYIRRCNDFNWSGWWCWAFMFLSQLVSAAIVILTDEDKGNVSLDSSLSLVAIIVSLVLSLISFILAFIPFFIRGTKGANKYGPDPLEKV